LLTAPGRTVLGDIVRPTRWTGHLNGHVSYSPEIATVMPCFSLSFTLIHYPQSNSELSVLPDGGPTY
jgi:hypothetical protein